MTAEQDEIKLPPSKNARNLKILGLLCFAFLLYLVWAADSGHLPNCVSFLYDFRYGDKVGHFVLYGGVAFFLCLAFRRTLKVWRLEIPLVALFFLLFALGEEWSQTLFFRRKPDIVDAICSALGIILGTGIASRINSAGKSKNLPKQPDMNEE
jgi:glycopeptide antibiotics resistance protein